MPDSLITPPESQSLADDLLDDLPSSTSFALDALDEHLQNASVSASASAAGSSGGGGGGGVGACSSTTSSMSPITTAAASSHVIVTAADQSGSGITDVEDFFANAAAAAATAPQWNGQQRKWFHTNKNGLGIRMKHFFPALVMFHLHVRAQSNSKTDLDFIQALRHQCCSCEE